MYLKKHKLIIFIFICLFFVPFFLRYNKNYKNSRFINNTTTIYGGAIGFYNQKEDGILSISNTLFEGNRALNQAENGAGGAIHLYGNTNVEIMDSEFISNSAYIGSVLDANDSNVLFDRVKIIFL